MEIVSIVIGVMGVVIGVVSILYGMSQSKERRKLVEYTRAQIWHLYSKANNASGHTQIAYNAYKKAYQDNLDMTVVESLSRADAFGQDVLRDIIRQIQISEPDFSRETIQRWFNEGRIEASHLPQFNNLTISDSEPARNKISAN